MQKVSGVILERKLAVWGLRKICNLSSNGNIQSQQSLLITREEQQGKKHNRMTVKALPASAFH